MDQRTQQELETYTRAAFKHPPNEPKRAHWWGYPPEDVAKQNEELSTLMPPGVRSVLEVGCGTGFLGDAIMRNNPSVEYSGFDIVEKNVEDAKKLFPHLNFYVGNYWNELLSKAYKFDFVISAGCLFSTTDQQYTELLFDVLHNASEKGFALYCLGGKKGVPQDIKISKMEEIIGNSNGVTRAYFKGSRDFLPREILRHNIPILLWREGIRKTVDVEVPDELLSEKKEGFGV